MRIVFMGTPEFAVKPLSAMVENGYEVVGVVTQPDRPVGRSKKLTPPPTKVYAEAHDIPVLQFEKIRRPEGRAALEALNPDLFVTAAFGQILSQKVLDIPRLGTINVHASLLPKYRGSAPINWVLINGEKKTGVTTMFTDAGIDTGDMLLCDEIGIDPDENAEELTEKLSELGAKTLLRTLKALEEGTLERVKQNEDEATYLPMLDKELGKIDWTKSATEIHNLVRGVYPWPGAYTTMESGVLKIWKTKVSDKEFEGKPGQIVKASPKEGLFVACGEGILEIVEMQAPSSKRMGAKDYLRGKPLPENSVLGELHDTEKD